MQKILDKYGVWLYAAIAQLVLISLVISRLSDAEILRHYLNTDYFYLPALYEDIINDGNSITDWHLTPAPYFFPDMLLYGIIYFFTSNIPLTAVIFGFCQLMLIEFLLYKICRLFFDEPGIPRRLMFLSTICIQLYLLITVLAPAESFFSCLLLSNTCHMGSIVCALLCTWLLMKYTFGDTGYKKYLYILFVVTCISIASDRLFLVEFIVPVAGWLLYRVRSAKTKWAALSISLATLAGWYLFKFIQHNLIHIPEAGKGAGGMLPSVINFMDNIWLVWRLYPFTSLVFILQVISFMLLVVLVFRAPAGIKPVFVFLFFSAGSSFFLPVLLGHIQAMDTFRYLNYAYLLLLMILPFSLYFLFKKIRIKNMVRGTGILYACLLLYMGIRYFSAQRMDAFLHFKPDFVKQVEMNDARLKDGIADYWFTKHVYALGGKKHRVVPVYGDGAAYVYQSNVKWFTEGGTGSAPVFNFSIDIKPRSLLIVKDSVVFDRHTLYIFEDFVFRKEGEHLKIQPL